MTASNRWRLLVTPGPARGAWNMAVDEAILEGMSRSGAEPTLRLYAWEPPCLSLGYAQPLADVDMERLEARGWEVVRRPTGGRAVLHTDELTYSIIAPLDDPRVIGSLLDSYQRLAGALVEALRRLVLKVEIQEKAETVSSQNPNPVCFEVPSAFEITVDGKKLIGSAQARRKEGVLQHGSLPLLGDLTRILQVLVFPNEAARQHAAKRLLQRATTLEAALGRPVTWQEAACAFEDAFRIKFELDLQQGELSESEKARAEELAKRKYAHPEKTEA